jgi:glycosyltransferase involved in cell wall biosynthesis
VTLTGRLSHEETIRQISNSKALISTSPMEGFPNIFIEAWACGVPVMSLFVDPGGVIEKEGLGEIVYGDFKSLLSAINSFTVSADFAERAKSYVQRHHALNKEKTNEIINLFHNIHNRSVVKDISDKTSEVLL